MDALAAALERNAAALERARAIRAAKPKHRVTEWQGPSPASSRNLQGPVDVELCLALYAELGVVTAVAKRMGRAHSTIDSVLRREGARPPRALPVRGGK